MTSDEQDFDLATPPAYAASLLHALALASLTWGRLEAEVDHLLMLTYAETAATASVREQIPNAWSSKCKASVDRFTKVSSLASKASEAGQLAQDLREAAEGRHALVHGGFAGFVPGEPPKLDMIRYVFDGAAGQVTLKHYSIAEADLHRFRAGVIARGAQVLKLSMWVAGRDDSSPSRMP